MKKILLIASVFAGFFTACPQPPTIMTETVEISEWSIGQKDGSLVVQWTDPSVDNLKSISVVTRLGEEVVDEGSVEPGTQTYTIPKDKVKVGESYLITIFGLDSENNKTAETSVPHTVSSANLLFESVNVYDQYAELKIASDASSQLTLEYGGQSITIDNGTTDIRIDNLKPGQTYIFTLRTENHSAATFTRKTMLFWDDFAYSTPEDLTASRWTWCHRENPNLENHWSFSMRGEGNAERVLFNTEEGVNFLRLEGYYKGEEKNPENMLGAGVRSQGCFYFTFGKVEIRFRFKDSLPGSFPALWMMPQNADPGCANGGSWPYGGEIDIMERVHSRPWLVYNTAHTENWSTAAGGYAGESSQYNVAGKQNGSGKAEDWNKWNIVGIEWSRGGLQWYVNGVRTKWIPAEDNLGNYPFTEKSSFYLIMNMSVAGGGFAGKAEPGFYNYIDIDYVKVTPNADTIVRECPYYTSGGAQ